MASLWDYIVKTAERITEGALRDVGSLDDWLRQRERRLREFLEMMGLWPLPERPDLGPQTLGEFRGEGYRAEKVAYQLLPDVWGTAHIYRPDPLPEGKLPAVLYVCGHKPVGTHGYQEHAILWARRGYVCLIFDTIEQGDNPGNHHGIYDGRRLDWVSLGYTPAGGELWNSIRALDLLLSLPEVDQGRVGATGISGGGAHSLFLAIADERVRAVASVAGTDCVKTLVSHRHVWGHCDCMFPFNLYRRDTSEFLALIAPRPLLLCFAREDSLYTPEGWRGMFERVRKVYELYGEPEKCQLFEYPGPHAYSPEAVERICQWFDRFVAGEERPKVELGGEEQDERATSVFHGAPPDVDRLDILPELLARRGRVRLPKGPDDWPRIREGVVRKLVEGPLRWAVGSEEKFEPLWRGDYLTDGRRHVVVRGEIGGVEVWLEALLPKEPTGKLVLGLAGPDEGAKAVLSRLSGACGPHGACALEPRGSGLTALNPRNSRDYVQALRSALWVGLTPTLLAVHDLLRALEFLRSEEGFEGQKVYLYGRGEAGVACLYVAALDESVAGVVVDSIPVSHAEGAHLIGILRVLDIPQALGLPAPRPVGVVSPGRRLTLWAERLYRRLGAPEGLVVGDLVAVMSRVLEF